MKNENDRQNVALKNVNKMDKETLTKKNNLQINSTETNQNNLVIITQKKKSFIPRPEPVSTFLKFS